MNTMKNIFLIIILVAVFVSWISLFQSLRLLKSISELQKEVNRIPEPKIYPINIQPTIEHANSYPIQLQPTIEQGGIVNGVYVGFKEHNEDSIVNNISIGYPPSKNIMKSLLNPNDRLSNP